MSFYSFLRYYVNRFWGKIFRQFGISLIYENRYGIKSINQLSREGKPYILREETIEANKLFIGFDALKDKFTLVGTSIIDSPHYDFLRTLQQGEDIKKTEYIKRYKSGFLDGRVAIGFSKVALVRFREKYCASLSAIKEETYSPIYVYRIGEKYYIADGKHRAAMCALCNQKVHCYIIPDDYLGDAFKLWIYRKMKKNAFQYSKNIILFENSVIY